MWKEVAKEMNEMNYLFPKINKCLEYIETTDDDLWESYIRDNLQITLKTIEECHGKVNILVNKQKKTLDIQSECIESLRHFQDKIKHLHLHEMLGRNDIQEFHNIKVIVLKLSTLLDIDNWKKAKSARCGWKRV